MKLEIDPGWLLRMAEKEGNGIISVGGLVTRIAYEQGDAMKTYPDARALRHAANLAIVGRCDDPLLPAIMERACAAAGAGERAARFDFPDAVEGGRREAIGAALEALGLRQHWSCGDPSFLSISWE